MQYKLSKAKVLFGSLTPNLKTSKTTIILSTPMSVPIVVTQVKYEAWGPILDINGKNKRC